MRRDDRPRRQPGAVRSRLRLLLAEAFLAATSGRVEPIGPALDAAERASTTSEPFEPTAGRAASMLVNTVLMLDELSMGLAPVVVSRLYEHVAAIAESGVAVLLVEQFAAAVLAIADYAAVLVRGAVAHTGRPDDAFRSSLSDLYLGSSA